MSKTYSEKIARLVANDLYIPYQVAYESVLRAVTTVYGHQEGDDIISTQIGNIPQHSRAWVSFVRQISRITNDYIRLNTKRNLSLTDRETIALYAGFVFDLSTDLEQMVGQGLHKDQVLCIRQAIIAAADNKFEGWGEWRPHSTEEVWDALVKEGYAFMPHGHKPGQHERTEACKGPSAECMGYQFALNDAGRKTFLTNDEKWTEVFNKLMDTREDY